MIKTLLSFIGSGSVSGLSVSSLGLPALVLALVLALSVQSCRLKVEQSAHELTKTRAGAQLALERTVSSLLRFSLGNSSAHAEGLARQLAGSLEREKRRELAARDRAALAAELNRMEKQHDEKLEAGPAPHEGSAGQPGGAGAVGTEAGRKAARRLNRLFGH